MNPQRTPREAPEPEETPSASGRRLFYEQALRASEQLQSPQGFVAIILLEVALAPRSGHLSERVLAPVTSKLATLLNRRLRSIDVLVRTANTELAVLLTQAHIGVAAAFSERLRQPIEQALREMELANDIVVCMGLAANPRASRWHPDALIELADFRMRTARQRAATSPAREWALAVDGEAVPEAWADSALWPATSEITSYSSL
jgi:diguanylate cyclase (GGDEF)-like protein